MIDTSSPPGSYRAALEPNTSCAACRQVHCNHPDAVYAGVAPVPVSAQAEGGRSCPVIPRTAANISEAA